MGDSSVRFRISPACADCRLSLRVEYDTSSLKGRTLHADVPQNALRGRLPYKVPLGCRGPCTPMCHSTLSGAGCHARFPEWGGAGHKNGIPCSHPPTPAAPGNKIGLWCAHLVFTTAPGRKWGLRCAHLMQGASLECGRLSAGRVFISSLFQRPAAGEAVGGPSGEVEAFSAGKRAFRGDVQEPVVNAVFG